MMGKGVAVARRAGLALCLLLTLWLASGCTVDQATAYSRAIAVFATGDYAAAALAFDKIGDYEQAATYAAYAHGLALYEQGDFAAAEPYFAQSQNFMYGKQRYAYCHAYVLEAAGDFAAAAAGYQSLGAFEDAPLRAAYCAARDAENRKDYLTALFDYETAGVYADAPARLADLQSQIYFHAKERKAAGDYETALTFFSLLGDYLSSQQEAKACKDFFRDQQYDQADQLVAAGQLQQAYDMFSGLSGYRDADTRAGELAAQLGIATEEDQPE